MNTQLDILFISTGIVGETMALELAGTCKKKTDSGKGRFSLQTKRELEPGRCCSYVYYA